MVAGLSSGLLAGPAMAAAPLSVQGLSGQQVEVCVVAGNVNLRGYSIRGKNQSNDDGASPEVVLGGDRSRQRCATLWNWWWKGEINVDFWADSGAKLVTHQCNVPVERWDTNRVTCTF
ncbi:hypothetical protein [Nonomuraea rosea]